MMDGLWVFLTVHGAWTTGRTFNEALTAALAFFSGMPTSTPQETMWQVYGGQLGYSTKNVNEIQKLWMASQTGLSASLDFSDLRNALRFVP